MGLLLQNGTDTLSLQDGTDLSLQAQGNPVQSPVTKVTPGDLGAAGYPAFFPCPTWEYAQDITGHPGRTPFDCGWVRQRRTWREENTSVHLSFEMKTTMFDPWNLWMVNNGYDWFTMFLDVFGGEKILTEVRLIGAIDWQYRAFDTILVNVLGELGAGALDYGPKDGDLDGGNDYGNFCVGVYVTKPLENYDSASFGDTLQFTVEVNEDATETVEYRWQEDGALIPGETGPTLSYTVPTVGSVLEEHTIKIGVNVTNPCGDAWSTGVITIPPDPACEPYTCSSLADVLRSEGNIRGSGSWDLLDPNFTATIPQYFRQMTPYSGGGRLSSDATGNGWDSSTGLGRTTQTVDDADLCEGPFIMSNDDDPASNELYLVGRPLWGSRLPNCSLAVVARDVDRGPQGAPDNYVFRGICGVSWYGQTDQHTGGIANTIRIGRDATNDLVIFNDGASDKEWSATYPLGTFSSSTPKLLQFVLQLDDLWYQPSTEQSYFYASYDMMAAYTYQVWVTDPVTKATDYQSGSASGRELQCWSRETSDPEPGADMPESHKPRSDDGTDTCYYLQGGWGGFYNLAINHIHGGEGAGALFVEGGANPGRLGTDLEIAFLRNFDDYEQPGYCSLPVNVNNRGRGRT